VKLATEIDWGKLAPLRLRARAIAEGVWAGAHRSARKGAGVEFGGHREYTPGDDLRWLDRRSLLLHDRLLTRQFETETDRALWLVVDATRSMAYRGTRAPAAKYAWCGVVAAALSRVAIASGDPVGLELLGAGQGARRVPASGGREVFDRVVMALESATVDGDAIADAGIVTRSLAPIARAARRGSIVVVLSDLLDLPPGAAREIAALGHAGRVVVVVQVLDPDERDFPFDGTFRLRALEGKLTVETDAQARERYLARLTELTARWDDELSSRGARFLRASTADDPAGVVRAIVEAAR
jgi:uncharacterized protein (DUF58 family)